MKKLIFSLVCLVSIGNFALASSVDDVAVGTLEKQDSQAIFGNKDVGAVSLSQSEMRDTEGKFSFKIAGFRFRFFEHYMFEITKKQRSLVKIKTINFYSKDTKSY